MNKQSFIKILLTVLMSTIGFNAYAYDIQVENADGVTIYYNYINDGKDLEVAQPPIEYSGNIVIPEEVTYMNRTRKVTSIDNKAFMSDRLISVSIPQSVTSIGSSAFWGCNHLSSVNISDIKSWCEISFYDFASNPLFYAHHLYLDGKEIKDLIIPNSVTSIKDLAFEGCSGLTSVTFPNSMTSISYYTFEGCSGLTSVTIPNTITSIEEGAFYGCSSLTSVTLPNSVISIGENSFYDCSALTSVNISNSVTSIGKHAFYGCSSLTSVNIPNSVTYINDGAFGGCTSLSSVTIGNGVTSIGKGAFGGDITTVISMIEEPFIIDKLTFNLNTFNNATLYVPKGSIDKYKSTEGWKNFMFIEEGTGPNGSDNTPETLKCVAPTIGYQNGKLTFNSETEGATCQYSITDEDIKSGNSNEVQLGVTYHISVYATKAGYENSDVATATLCWIDVEPKTEGISNGIANVRARAVLIQSNGNQLKVSGADEGTDINVFDITGKYVGFAKVTSDVTTINTSLRSGEIGIVKIGEKAIKVIIK